MSIDVVLAVQIEDARVVARHHRVLGPDCALDGAPDQDLASVQLERALDALCIAPEETAHQGIVGQ
jgi:hypothetical protein